MFDLLIVVGKIFKKNVKINKLIELIEYNKCP